MASVKILGCFFIEIFFILLLIIIITISCTATYFKKNKEKNQFIHIYAISLKPKFRKELVKYNVGWSFIDLYQLQAIEIDLIC